MAIRKKERRSIIVEMLQGVSKEVDAVQSKPQAARDVGERSDTTLSKPRAVTRETRVQKHQQTLILQADADRLCLKPLAKHNMCTHIDS